MLLDSVTEKIGTSTLIGWVVLLYLERDHQTSAPLEYSLTDLIKLLTVD